MRFFQYNFKSSVSFIFEFFKETCVPTRNFLMTKAEEILEFSTMQKKKNKSG